MSTQHTPGPWTNHGRIPQPGLPHSSVAAKTLIARVYSEAFGDEAQEKANADLIAAAPDLLDALQKIPQHYMDDMDAHTPGVAQMIRAAIAKAEGKS